MVKTSEIKVSIGDRYQKGNKVYTVIKLTQHNAILSCCTMKYKQEINLVHLKSCKLYIKL